MGHKLLREYLSLDYDKNVVAESKDKKLPLIVKALMQRANAKNQNGRVYPKEILAREMKNYEKAVREGRATGELDHPDCIQEGAKILTKNGWKDFRDINDNEYIYTLNCETQNIELQKINQKIEQSYNGTMYRFKGRNIDCAFTPHHRFWLVNRHGKGFFATAQEIVENRKKYNKCYIPKLGNWIEPEEKEVFVLSGFSGKNNKAPVKYNTSVSIDLDVWSSFLGLYLAEGCVASKDSYRVQITQKHEGNKKLIRELLARFPKEIEWKEKCRPDDPTKSDFIVHDARLHQYLLPLGKSHEKYIPDDAKLMSSPCLENLIEWFVIGDGKNVESNGYFSKSMFSTSRRLIEDLNEILLKSGRSGNIHTEIPQDRLIEGRLIKAENSRPLHFLHISTTRGIYLDDRFLTIEPIKYDGMIYCVNVPNQTFYCMDLSGKTYWSGNSSVISLENISHIVREVWWDGDEVWGKVEILDTPKGRIAKDLMAAGVKLGISSRGIGETMTHEDGTEIVDESFVLLCFDLVSEPSTNEAWLMREGKKIETKDIKKLISKVDRINRIVNEILK